MKTLHKSIYFLAVVMTLLFYSTAYAENWIDISPKNQKGEVFADFDSITLLPNPKRVAYRYKSLSETVNLANVVILCNDAKYYFDSVIIYRVDGSIVGADDKDSALNSLMSRTFAYWIYQKYCFVENDAN